MLKIEIQIFSNIFINMKSRRSYIKSNKLNKGKRSRKATSRRGKVTSQRGKRSNTKRSKRRISGGKYRFNFNLQMFENK